MRRLRLLLTLATALLAPGVARAQQATASPHGSDLKEACSTCHRADAWKPAKISENFKHAPSTFPLEGAHEQTACLSCHKRLDFKQAPVKCASCHEDVHHGELGTDCARCHTPRSFVDRASMKRAHEQTRFPLRGAHAVASCDACHVPAQPGQMQFVNRTTTCFGCHENDYRTAKTPDHQASGFPQDCAACHSIVAWNTATFDHDATAFPLVGAHIAVTCDGCHADKVYKGKSTACASCHQADYDKTTNPPHQQGFPTTCTDCHTVTAWTGATFDHNTTQFPLTGAHGAQTCAACHGDGVFKGKPTACASCHQGDFDKTSNPTHPAAGFSAECATCHTTTAWAGGTFDHASTGWPLTGQHIGGSCAGCHGDNVFHGKSTDCYSCHRTNYEGTQNPPHAATGFPTTCTTCHNTNDWSGTPFDHTTTRFPLTGAHRALTCANCHGDGVYQGRPMECYSCHKPDYDNSVSPKHGAAGFSTSCTTCHTTTNWTSSFDHASTGWALTGQHIGTACSGCHGDGVFHGKATDCYSCHRTNYDGTRNPPHVASGFPTTCTTCHNTNNWTGAPFDHNATQFPLTGAHLAVSCANCHGDGVYKGKPTDCYSCHRADYDNSSDPKHGTAGFATTCATCHTTTNWSGATFDHATTGWPLTGLHASASCASCHGDNVFHGKSTECYACHRTNYDATQNPPHTAVGYPTSCATCHNTNGWTGTPFNHDATQFPLTGAHRAVTCSDCHGDGVYKGKPTDCYSCHKANFDNSADPKHSAAGFSTSCTTCHTTTAWTSANFNHGSTGWPLTGKHIGADCAQCHGDNVFHGKATNCYSCHRTEFDATSNPPHASSGFPNTCETCHTTAGWTGSPFDHNTTQFPLTGAHKAATCADCHGDGVYKGKPTDCYSCHKANYDGTQNPKHSAAGFATTCVTCHSTTDWNGASFDHSTTGWPLTGLHIGAACLDCHGDGVFHGKPTACYSCHKTNYDNTTNPPHASSGFPNTCDNCHTTSTWTGSPFDHNATQFPLTGAHLAASCADCHGDGVYKGKPTNCYSCHTSDYNSTTKPPHASSSIGTTCATCHTTTQWPGATYDHSKTSFPLTGAHVAATCAQCHGTGVYHGTPTDCYSCHQADYTATSNPNHAAAQFPTTCVSCHTTTTWTGATFNHDSQFFPIYSGHHRGTWSTCSTCHTSPTNFSVFTCLVCHEHNQTSMDSKHRGRSGYAYDSQKCYSCHPRGSGG